MTLLAIRHPIPLGGNPSVAAVVSGNEAHYGQQGKSGYMAGKYSSSGPELTVKYDDTWQDMPEAFSVAVSVELRRRVWEVSPLMQLLGHAPLQELL